MYPVPTECPVCHDDLHVSQLACRTCGTEIRGTFEMDRLAQLIPEQRYFVEVFLLCEGKLNCVQDELGISYPTVRSRLDEIIRALKRERTTPLQVAPLPQIPPAPPGSSAPAVDMAQHQEILDRLARREISLEEALQLLEEI
ncbi:MAG TPA: DUF2089 domain-containing protein [Anaerolineae bacterium]|nr:DUF2089 domain-containing protein [Anaerolineae bacterium]HQH38366.1 DUF2089 domain-containing protein [Anaerolineae bacterium]